MINFIEGSHVFWTYHFLNLPLIELIFDILWLSNDAVEVYFLRISHFLSRFRLILYFFHVDIGSHWINKPRNKPSYINLQTIISIQHHSERRLFHHPFPAWGFVSQRRRRRRDVHGGRRDGTWTSCCYSKPGDQKWSLLNQRVSLLRFLR